VQGMNVSKLSPKIIVAILIAVIFAVSLIFRIVLAQHQVFTSAGIKFTGIDAYFYQRIIDNTAVNFPHMMHFDPYFIYPGGRVLTDIFFPAWLVAGFAWVFGLGAPTQHIIDIVSVLFPAVCAALTVIPVYFIGKTLFNRWAGVMAAGLMAVFPGEFLGRTIIGGTDTPYMEILLTTTFLCFVILAVKVAREREVTFEDVLRRDWSKCRRPIIFSALAGLFLGLYLLSWQGALLFAFIFALYLVIQAVRDHLRQRSVDNLGIVGGLTFLVALVIFAGYSPGSLYLAAMVVAFLIPVALAGISRVITRWKFKIFNNPVAYPIALVVIAGIALGVFYLINPDLLHSMLSRFRIFSPSGSTGQTTIELQPLLDPNNTGSLSTVATWGYFTTSFFLFSKFAFPGLALIALAMLIYLFIRKKGQEQSYTRQVTLVTMILAVIMAELLLYGYGYSVLSLVPLVILFLLLFWPGNGEKNWLLFIVWSLVMLALTLPSRRYAYYLVVNIALLSGYLCWQILWLAGIRKLGAKSAAKTAPVRETRSKSKRKEKRRAAPSAGTFMMSTALTGLALFFLVYYPNIMSARNLTTTEAAPYAPSDAWEASLVWLKDNSPEPFGDPEAYYRQYPAPAPGETFDYPSTAYGVTSWWDYGYWILEIAHRMPSANPAQDPAPIINVANLFLSEDNATTQGLMQEMGSSYVILDYTLPRSKFWAVATWAGQSMKQFFNVYIPTKYYDIYYVQDQQQWIYFYNPDYYRTLSVRLYNFDGKAVTEEQPMVITWTEQVDANGVSVKIVSAYQQFDSYQEAQDYIDSQASGNYSIVGVSPFISPISLEAVPDFQLVHASEQGTSLSGVGFVPEIKIFAYVGQ
jgi:oligosaccharyl transferase (archaeosortase A-associated)